MTPQIPKPEWFQMIEADSIQPRPRINRVTRMLALSTPLLVLGMGYMVAHGSTQGVPASSIQVASAPAQATHSTPAATATSPSNPQARVVTSSFTTPASPLAPITKPTGGSDEDEIASVPTGSSVAGSISVMPTGGSDDDDEGVEEDD